MSTDLDALEALHAETTPNWQMCRPCTTNTRGCNLVWSPERQPDTPLAGGDEVCATNADARFMAIAHQTVPGLIAETRALRARVADLEAAGRAVASLQPAARSENAKEAECWTRFYAVLNNIQPRCGPACQCPACRGRTDEMEPTLEKLAQNLPEERALRVLPKHLEGVFWNDVRKRLATEFRRLCIEERARAHRVETPMPDDDEPCPRCNAEPVEPGYTVCRSCAEADVLGATSEKGGAT